MTRSTHMTLSSNQIMSIKKVAKTVSGINGDIKNDEGRHNDKKGTKGKKGIAWLNISNELSDKSVTKNVNNCDEKEGMKWQYKKGANNQMEFLHDVVLEKKVCYEKHQLLTTQWLQIWT